MRAKFLEERVALVKVKARLKVQKQLTTRALEQEYGIPDDGGSEVDSDSEFHNKN